MAGLAELLAKSSPVKREVKVGGASFEVWFKPITAGQREQLLQGQKVQSGAGGKAVIELDLGSNQRTKQMLVQFSACDEAGKPAFESLDAVKEVEARVVEALYEKASAFNDEVDAGKA